LGGFDQGIVRDALFIGIAAGSADVSSAKLLDKADETSALPTKV